jgi:carbon monoxide dehydrogenase subunit G
MHLSGETEIKANRQRVWDTISNPVRVADSNASGQAQIEKVDDRHYRVTVSAPSSMMPINVVLGLALTEVDAPSRLAATVAGAIMGGPITGTGSIDLRELDPKSTICSWVADVSLGGMLGGFEPMIQGPLQQAANQAFASLKTRLEEEETAGGG